jgi:hypothetical protein
MRLAIAALTFAVIAVVAAGGDRGGAEARAASYTRTCEGHNGLRAWREPAVDDARLGRAKLVSFRHLFENAEADEVYTTEDGKRVLKAALAFKGRRDLTISVPKSHRAVLRLQYKSNRSAGHPSVRFRSCARGRYVASGYPGAMIYTGPWPACVPLDVAVGDRPPRRYALSLGAGPCQVPK